jgi:hypothetical protein
LQNPEQMQTCLIFHDKTVFVYSKFFSNNILFRSRGIETCKKQIAIFVFKMAVWIFIGPLNVFIPYYIVHCNNLHTKFQKNPSLFAESRANINIHHFSSKTASWQLIWDCDSRKSRYVKPEVN